MPPVRDVNSATGFHACDARSGGVSVTREVAAYLRRTGIQLHIYLADWLITSSSQVESVRDMQMVRASVSS